MGNRVVKVTTIYGISFGESTQGRKESVRGEPLKGSVVVHESD